MNVSEFKVLKLTKEQIQMEQNPFLKKHHWQQSCSLLLILFI